MPLPRLQSMYTEMVLLIRKLYQECRLVHGDLSEYNILVDDVSTAVDLSSYPAEVSVPLSGPHISNQFICILLPPSSLLEAGQGRGMEEDGNGSWAVTQVCG